jgi:hypothetical protein
VRVKSWGLLRKRGCQEGLSLARCPDDGVVLACVIGMLSIYTPVGMESRHCHKGDTPA